MILWCLIDTEILSFFFFLLSVEYESTVGIKYLKKTHLNCLFNYFGENGISFVYKLQE